MTFSWRLLAAFLLGLLVVSAFAQTANRQEFRERLDQLNQLVEARLNLVLEGERVVNVRQNGQVRTHRERVRQKGFLTRIDLLGSKNAGQVVVENGRERRHYYPEGNKLHVMPSRGALELLRHYVRRVVGEDGPRGRARIDVADGGTVAGKSTRRLAFYDAAGRLRQKVWIDVSERALLKREVYDENGRLTAGFEFTRVSYPATLDASLFRLDKPGVTVVRPLDSLIRTARQMGMEVYYVPAATGYLLMGAKKIELAGQEVLSQVYANEDTRFSLFQVKGAIDRKKLAEAGGDRFNTLAWSRDRMSFVLIGALEVEELREIADEVTGVDRR